MSLKIMQTCDKCGASREIPISGLGVLGTIKDSANKDGWREVQNIHEGKHLCAKCIRQALADPPIQKEEQ